MTSQPGKKNGNYRHGFATKKRHPLYLAYYNMMSRCYNPKNKKYPRYGGRGILVCDNWKDKINFWNWAISAGWSEGLTLDRILLDGNYEPKNCQWMNLKENSRKKSTTKLSMTDAINIRKRLNNNEKHRDLAKEYKVNKGTIWFIENNFTHK